MNCLRVSYLEDMPEHVVVGWVVEEPELVDVAREPADGEHDDERENETGNLLASLHLRYTSHTHPPFNNTLLDRKSVV